MKEKSKAICDNCGGWVDTTLAVRDVPCSSGELLYKDIPCYVCDVCDSVVATPPQAASLMKQQREKGLK